MIVACAIACAVLVFAEYRKLARLRMISKAIASAAFVIVGLPALGAGPFQTAIVIGLVFGALGDLALLGTTTKSFLLGLTLFLVGHVAYVVGLAQLESPQYWIVFSGRLGIFTVLGGVLALRWLWPHVGALKVPVVLYVVAIVLMVVGALAAWSTGAIPAPQRHYLAVGALLFFVSDLAVARERFIAKSFTNKLWGLPAYYAAQLLIASAIS